MTEAATDLNIMNERVACEEARESRLPSEPRSPVFATQAKDRIIVKQDQEKRIWVKAGMTSLLSSYMYDPVDG